MINEAFKSELITENEELTIEIARLQKRQQHIQAMMKIDEIIKTQKYTLTDIAFSIVAKYDGITEKEQLVFDPKIVKCFTEDSTFHSEKKMLACLKDRADWVTDMAELVDLSFMKELKKAIKIYFQTM